VLGAIPDDHVVVEPKIEQLGSVGELPGEAEVLAGWGRVSGRVIVDEDQRGGSLAERGTKYLAGMDQASVDTSKPAIRGRGKPGHRGGRSSE